MSTRSSSCGYVRTYDPSARRAVDLFRLASGKTAESRPGEHFGRSGECGGQRRISWAPKGRRVLLTRENRACQVSVLSPLAGISQVQGLPVRHLPAHAIAGRAPDSAPAVAAVQIRAGRPPRCGPSEAEQHPAGRWRHSVSQVCRGNIAGGRPLRVRGGCMASKSTM